MSTGANGFCASLFMIVVSFLFAVLVAGLLLLSSLQESNNNNKQKGSGDFMPENTLFQ
jgi:hypothetical protein